MEKTRDDDYEIIFRPCITTKSGKKIWAYQYGKKAFLIRIRRKGNVG
ncbi:MAG: hypothetical protein ACYCX4_17990 [Bacillota bacterium]